MSQMTLSDDDLFGEAADEIRDDIEACLASARAELPTADELWTIEGENALGVLNGLRSALDVDAARDHLHDAKKWYVIGDRADAFEDPDSIETEIRDLEALIDDLEAAKSDVTPLINALPELRSTLESIAADEA